MDTRVTPRPWTPLGDRPIRYGIVGAGMMGQEHIRNLALLDRAEVRAIVEPDAAMRAAALALAPGAVALPDLSALASEVDAVIVAAPNHLHHPMMLELMPMDLPVLCEKPLGVSPDECRELEAMGRTRAAPVWVAMEYRFMPAIARLIDAAAAGAAGRPVMLSIREHRFPFLPKVGHWNRFQATTGGTLVEKCCHFFDLMRLILGAEPVRVFASAGQDVNHRTDEGGPAADVLDNAFVVVDFQGGLRASLDLCMFAEGSRWQEHVILTGDRAQLTARVPGPPRFAAEHRPSEFSVAPRETRREATEAVETDPRIQSAGDHHGSTYYQHERFLRMLREGGAPAVTLTDGRLAVDMGAAAEASARSGQPVTL